MNNEVQPKTFSYKLNCSDNPGLCAEIVGMELGNKIHFYGISEAEKMVSGTIMSTEIDGGTWIQMRIQNGKTVRVDRFIPRGSEVDICGKYVGRQIGTGEIKSARVTLSPILN